MNSGFSKIFLLGMFGFLFIGCMHPRLGTTVEKIPGTNQTCVRPGDEVVRNTSFTNKVSASISKWSASTDLSVQQQVQRIRQENPDLNKVEVMTYLLCVERANGR